MLLLITVYDGRSFVPRCIDSACRLESPGFDLDILVLDDASPSPGWSEELRQFCADRAVGYYCTPRNLGIPRNVSLGLLAAVEGDYTHVVISNSDVVYAANAMSQLLACLDSDPTIGSATAFSTNVSIYSMPNEDPDLHISDQPVVDWIGTVLAGTYGDVAIDVPAGISFSMMIPIEVVKAVGTMDPVFGRGYCEETDWSLRSHQAGYRVVLAPGAFVYHEGGGSNREAGLLAPGNSTVIEHERIIDLRYPLFRSQVEAFGSSGILEELHANSQAAVVRASGRQFGYVIQVGWLPRVTAPEIVRVMVSPSHDRSAVVATFRGFSAIIEAGSSVAEAIRSFFGREPSGLDLFSYGPYSQQMQETFPRLAAASENRTNYPERV
ncbi:MAG: glycosyltransferase family 2 protein [Ilumatobacteraceae bacterium]